MRFIPSRHVLLLTLGVGLWTASPSVTAHDLFFRAPRYTVEPGDRVVVDVLNGTFSRSENAITRDRLASLVMVGPAGSRDLSLDQWGETEPQSTLEVVLGGAGSYAVGAAVRPRMLELSGKDFGAYLEEEGLQDVLAARRNQRRLDQPSRERYSKFLKALFQVGALVGPPLAALGHAAEIVPEQNPYALAPGDRLTVRCLVDGRPWAGKTVFAGGRRGGGDQRFPPQRLVTDGEGRAVVRLEGAGTWYVKMVAMREVEEAEANYESRWATLSFAVRPTPAR